MPSDDRDDMWGWIIFVGVVMLIVCVLFGVHSCGMDDGAKAHARGELVVQTLADGSEVVVRVKKDKEAGK